MTTGTVYIRNPAVSATEIDAETFLVEPDEGEVFYLDEVSSALWRFLSEARQQAEIETCRDHPDLGRKLKIDVMCCCKCRRNRGKICIAVAVKQCGKTPGAVSGDGSVGNGVHRNAVNNVTVRLQRISGYPVGKFAATNGKCRGAQNS